MLHLQNRVIFSNNVCCNSSFRKQLLLPGVTDFFSSSAAATTKTTTHQTSRIPSHTAAAPHNQTTRQQLFLEKKYHPDVTSSGNRHGKKCQKNAVLVTNSFSWSLQKQKQNKSYIKKISIQVFTTTALPAQSGTRLSNEVREEKPKTKKQKKSP
jgi:lantibiotic modifying enzyme